MATFLRDVYSVSLTLIQSADLFPQSVKVPLTKVVSITFTTGDDGVLDPSDLTGTGVLLNSNSSDEGAITEMFFRTLSIEVDGVQQAFDVALIARAAVSDFLLIPLTPDGNFRAPISAEQREGYTLSPLADPPATISLGDAVVPVDPVAEDDTAEVDEDESVDIDVIGNDENADSVTDVSDPSSGSATINADGTITYTPNDDFNGTDTFTYTIDNGAGLTDEGEVTVTVNPINDDPVVEGEEAEVVEDGRLDLQVIQLLANDSDIDGDDLTITEVTATNGEATLGTPFGGLAPGNLYVTYIPDADYNGPATITYTVSDSNGGTTQGEVAVNVTPVNDNPTAENDSGFETDEDTPVVLAGIVDNDFDIDGDTTLTATPFDSRLQLVDGELVFTPSLNSNGVQTAQYLLSDGNGGTSVGLVEITVNPVNDAPTPGNDSATVDEDGSVAIDLLENDSDVDGDELDPNLVDLGDPANGTVEFDGEEFIYRPNDNFNGSDSFTYTVDDGNGGTATATVNVTINPLNDAPEANDDTAATAFETPVDIDVLSNDEDVDGDELTVVSASSAHGDVGIGNDGTLTFTPNEGFSGEAEILYTIEDPSGAQDTATATVNVADEENAAPVAEDDDVTVQEDSITPIDVLANDEDPNGDSLAVEIDSGPANGEVEVVGGSVVYTPDDNFNGSDSFEYSVSDGEFSDTATVTITVEPVNDNPVAADDTLTTDEDTTGAVELILGPGQDTDVDGDLLQVVSATIEGTALALNNITEVPGLGTVSLGAGGRLEVTPSVALQSLGQDDTAEFTGSYSISDGAGGADSASIQIVIEGRNDAPMAEDDFGNGTAFETPITIDVLANDTDPDDNAVLSIVSVEDGGDGTTEIVDGQIVYTPNEGFSGPDSFTYIISDGTETSEATVDVTVGEEENTPPDAQDVEEDTDEDTPLNAALEISDEQSPVSDLEVEITDGPNAGEVELGPNGTFTYTPEADFNGEDSFDYFVTDPEGETSETRTVTITVKAVNDAPVAADGDLSTNEDTAANGSLAFSDVDTDLENLVVEIVDGATNGDVVLGAGNQFTYTPDADFNGDDSFTYRVSDGELTSETRTVSITVNPVNDDPIANDDDATVDEDKSVVIDLLGNDEDVDGDELTVELGTPSNGTVIFDGEEFVYTPNKDYNGDDSFTYTIDDGEGGSDMATVSITVNPINDNPVAVDDEATVQQGEMVVVDVVDNDTDVDGDDLFLDGVTPVDAAEGVAEIVDGQLKFTAADDFVGSVEISYEVSDGQGGVDTGTATIEVTEQPNTAPTADDFDVSVDEDDSVALNLLGNVFDADGDELTFEFGDPSNGQVVVDEDGVRYMPNANYNGSDSFTYTVSDGNGGSATATISVEVDPVNDDPDAVDDSFTLVAGGTLFMSAAELLANDSDVDGDTIAIFTNSLTPIGEGRITGAGEGGFTYNSDDFVGNTSFTYGISDGNGGTDTATVFLTIEAAPNEAPIAADDVSSTDAETAISIAVLANDDDPDGDDLTVSVDPLPVGQGSVSVTDDGEILYDPNGAFDLLPLGEEETVVFEYTVSDGELTDTAEVEVTISGTFVPEPEPNIITGTAGRDNLVGTDGVDIISSLGGSYDRMTGGGDADQFVFGDETSNGRRERDLITDYEVGLDSIVLEDGAAVANMREYSSRVLIQFEGDGDVLYVLGDGVTADNLTFVDVFDIA